VPATDLRDLHHKLCVGKTDVFPCQLQAIRKGKTMKTSRTPLVIELRRKIELMDQDYQKLKRANEALRDEIHILRQQLPTVDTALKESITDFADNFIELR
jgi:cell division protein FtsB